jgi:hypothetical protein
MENRDEKLWRQAKKRVNTKKNGIIYIAIILILWLIWGIALLILFITYILSKRKEIK